VPAVEQYGVEPIPADFRTVRWPDLFAINFTFFLNPVMYVLGALAVVDGGLPLPWAVAATVLGQALAFGLLVIVAQPGVDHGLPGQVAMRASLGLWGARGLSSPYRMVAATYWFAAQALAGSLGIQAIVVALGGDRPPLVPVALGLAAFHATLAVLGFDVMRYVLRVVLPLSLVFTAVLLALYLASDDERFAVGRVLESPDQHLTWKGFATYVTVMCGASLTLVTNVADLCRYTPTRRDLRIGLLGSSVLAVGVTTFVGGYAAAATGQLNPFIAVAELTRVEPLLVLLLAAIVVQGIAANITNVYTAGLSLVNAAPPLGRLGATLVAAAAAIGLSAFPEVIEEAERWVAHLGNVAAPLTGVVLADYLLVKRGRIDVEALFDPAGRYRYVSGVNAAALLAVATGVALYSALPHAWLKVVWGLAAGAVAYAALEPLQQTLLARSARAPATTEAA
jgi:nucleobase:cation symporter-1, NCS1 family